MKNSFDIIIIGAGITGLAAAWELKKKDSALSVAVLEKENDTALHASGRNSGVLHAGFYYTADSLKAKFTRDGNTEMKNFCRENGIPVNECGKVVVARNEHEIPGILELARRAEVNGVTASLIDTQELENIDPNVKTYEKALHVPATASVDPLLVCQKLKLLLSGKGVEFFFNTRFQDVNGGSIKTSKGIFFAKQYINCAGLYADAVARRFGFSRSMTIIPFKGIYLKYTGTQKPVRINVYPVPDLRNPFLGVHYTVTASGDIKIGPTSIPAFWRENYTGFDNLSIPEAGQVLLREMKLFMTNAFGFRDLALSEIKKYRRKYFISLAEGLVKNCDSINFNKWMPPGIRAQLLDLKTGLLVMDFVIERGENSIHVLNAVSPAFTCAFPFTRHIITNWL